MDSNGLTTSQAAKLCSVSRDTVLKWVKSGKVPARRTAGGHYRIVSRDIRHLEVPVQPGKLAESSIRRPFQYCWEYHGKSNLQDGCRECVVYLMRAERCYQLADRAHEIGHNRIFCKKNCLECEYYRLVHQQAVNVLVITDNEILIGYLRRDAKSAPFNLEITDCEYSCSALVEHFRPDYVVIDCSLGTDKARYISNHLLEDPRIPHVRVILAVEAENLPASCNRGVFAYLEKPFSASDIIECLNTAKKKIG